MRAEDGGTGEQEVTVVVAAVDTSTLASRVIDVAARFARRVYDEAHLHLVHVYREGPFERPTKAGFDAEELRAEAQSYLDYHVRSARRMCPAPVTAHFASGDAVEEVLRLARSLRADWLIVGTHDPTGLDRFLMGSVAEKISKRAPCSVIVVRAKQRPYVKVTT